MTSRASRASLLPDRSQYEVDFVIPRIGVDLPLGIDPFLLYKSRDPVYRTLHERLIAAFNAGIAALRRGDMVRAREILSFPEASEIGLGYTVGGKRGSGVGTQLTGLILEALSASSALMERGVHHVEEMQLLSAGIGKDRVSDIAANVLKSHLIEYTQRQSEIWNIPLTSGVPVSHIYEPDLQHWVDGYFDLPTSPIDDAPILLVPRRIVRLLPWINYDDFLRTEFRAYLDARRQQLRLRDHRRETPAESPPSASKADVVTITRGDLALVERYVRGKEQSAADARPTMEYVDEDLCEQGKVLKRRLAELPAGREHAGAYQHLLLETLNHLFIPELIDGEPEVRTIDGTERRDIIFTNDSDQTFWEYVRTEHSSIFVMFEAKNTRDMDMNALNQTANYLGDRLGTLGFIATRQEPSDSVQRKAYAIWNDSAPKRKVILFLSDSDLVELLDLACQNGSPTKWIQRRYREFRTKVQ